jgi:hypothetical protein
MKNKPQDAHVNAYREWLFDQAFLYVRMLSDAWNGTPRFYEINKAVHILWHLGP